MLEVYFVQLKPEFTNSKPDIDIGNWIFNFVDLPVPNHVYTFMGEALLGGVRCTLD